jgi:hypothetical protein
MSTHLLTAWNARAQALHTAADDLESFLWVLIWSLNCCRGVGRRRAFCEPHAICATRATVQ